MPEEDRWFVRRHPKLLVTEDGCWLWTGTSTQTGYGMRWDRVSRRMVYLHRVNYESAFGPIPDGLQIDHLCRRQPCCNPAHLEAVTAKENVRRSDSPSGRQARQTHCKKGHPFSGANLQIVAGKRRCATCNRDAARAFRARRRSAA